MLNFTKLVLLISLIPLSLSLTGQSSCSQSDPFLLPPTSTFCADQDGFVTVEFPIHNLGESAGTYRVEFPDGTDTTYTGVKTSVNVSKKFLFNCGSPPGQPTPPTEQSRYFEYASALTVTRLDCVDERGDNQKGTYDFRVVPNPIVGIKHGDLGCRDLPFVMNFEGKLCSEELVQSYQWYIDGQLIEGATEKKYKGHVITAPGTYVVRLEATTYKCSNTYAFEKIIKVTAKPKIDLTYRVDSTTLCDEVVQVFPNLQSEHATSFSWSSDSEAVSFSDPADPNPVITIRNERAGTHTIRVSAKNSNCSAKEQSFDVTTQRGQTVQVLEEIVTCTGYSLDLCEYVIYAPEPKVIEWSADRAGVDFSNSASACPTVTFDQVGEHVLTATGRDACGESYTVQVPVRVRSGARLVIDLSAVDTLCETDASFSLLDYISPAAQVSHIVGPAVVDNEFHPDMAAGRSEILVTDSCGFPYPLEIFVIQQEKYTAGNPRLCIGDSIDLFGLQAGEYRGPGVTGNVFRSAHLAPGDYRIAFQSLSRCGGKDSLTVRVEPLPEAGFAVTTDSCGHGSAAPRYAGLNPVRLENRSTAKTLSYRVLGTKQVINDRDKVQFQFTEPGVYTIQQVVAFPGGSCTDTTEQRIEILMPPVIDFAYAVDSSACDSLTIDLSAGDQPSGLDYRWVFTNLERSTQPAPQLDLLRPLAPEVLGVDLSVMNACYTSADTFGIVLPQRFRVSFDVLNDNNTVCSDDTVYLANTSVNAKDFLVTFPDGRQAGALPDYLLLKNTTDKVLKYPITLRGSNDNCPDQTVADTIFVLPVTTRAAFGIDYPEACSSADVTLTNATTPGARCFVDWGDGSTPQAVGDLGQLQHRYAVNRDTTFEITLAAALCGRDTFRRRITIRPAPDPSFAIAAVDANCIGQDLVFAPDAGAAAYGLHWDFGDGTFSQEATPVHAYEKPGKYRVGLTATAANGCSARDSFDLEIEQYNGAALDFRVPTAGCAGEELGLELVRPLTGWRIDYGNGREVAEPLDRPYPEEGRYTMRVTATSENGCTRDSTVAIAIHPAFTAAIRTASIDTVVGLGDKIPLRVAVTPPRNISEVQWVGDSIDNPGAAYTTAYPIRDGRYSVMLEDVHGCTASDSLFVRVDAAYADRIYAPNVFSPNGDGYNETFGIEVKSNTVTRIRSIRVMNRFGAVVYECTDCPAGTQGTGWDGTLGGRPLQGNVYIWAAEVDFVDGSSQIFSGDVTLLR
ncbi:PKD domain-containing protein [Lewinella sp. IMCC34183]|uniref:PKD domain-containing protein n=1 Tax=Lewinella sp. IMCC34183 TaxID=2248762 RepID=UPI000E22FE80|nr:PKD domain-containing protein [Lewinella sp. IMCC34183]